MVEKGVPIFPRLDAEVEIEYIREQMRASVKTPQEEEKKNKRLKYRMFRKLQLMTSKSSISSRNCTACEPVPKTDKLLKIQVDLGYEQRQVVSGIAEHYKPEELIGQKVIVVANLKPVKLRGELSQGMILAGSHDGVLKIATVDSSLENGAKVK